jgi:2-oxoglutarate ferredoxin oxidoreductase subunit alpha
MTRDPRYLRAIPGEQSSLGRTRSELTQPRPLRISEHIIEIVSDSGEGAQKTGQILGAVSAKMGNGVWTVEIIPAEIKPPARSKAGASGIRIRLSSQYVTNMGDEANLAVALNEQVLYGRIDTGAYKPGTVVLLESKWRTDASEEIVEQYKGAVAYFRARGLVVHELPIEEACREVVPNPRLGKNMFVLGMLCHIYQRDLDKVFAEAATAFSNKGKAVIEVNRKLILAGIEFAKTHLALHYQVMPWPHREPLVVMNGNQALALGVMASGMELVAMYPITPATSASHYLAAMFHETGGFVHQAEDEIAAISFAVGASFAGRTACTITSGPGLALKMESIGLAVMAEIPLVIVSVQRGGPATGLPTKVEQGDLLAALFGSPGDAPKIVLAAATIEECFHFVIAARELAESFRSPVILLTDANLATGVQPIPRPTLRPEWFSLPIDQSPWQGDVPAYAWDGQTGLSPRPIPGQRGGEYVATGLAHTAGAKVAYDAESNARGLTMRSRKLATLRQTLKPPAVNGEESGDLLVVGWGSTLGTIEEAVGRARADGHRISSLHLRFLSPLEPGLKAIFTRFHKVMTVEINYSDVADTPTVAGDGRRYGQLAWLLRAETLCDLDCWSQARGHPLQPAAVYEAIKGQLGVGEGERMCSA